MQRELHTLKGNAATFGVERLSTVTKNIEKSLKENKFGDFNPQLDLNESESVEFKESYKNFINI